MYYQTGNMRDLHNDSSPKKNTIVWDRQNQFQYAQRSKYQKSQLSYVNHQKSKVVYQHQKSQKLSTKANQTTQVSVVLPIKIKSTQREDYMNTFKIQLLNMVEKNNNCLIMHITNDADSLFLWSFYVRESQFLNLKNQQSLRVDFHGFPEVVIEHLNYCSNFDKQASNQLNKNPIFYAVLDIKKGNEEAQLKIIQANKYKESLHLSLKFKKANDQQVKVYLSQKYDKERKENMKLTNQLMQAEHKLNLRMQELEKTHVEFEEMEKEKSLRIEELQRRQKEKIKQLTLRIQEENMRKQKYETEKTNKQINDLNDKIEELRSKNQQLLTNYQRANERIINLQASQNSLKSKCSILTQQNESFEKSNKQLKAKDLKNNQQYHLLTNQNTKLACTIQSLQEKIKERDVRLSQNSQLKSNNYSQISGLEQNLKQEKQRSSKLQQKNSTLEKQISKLQAKNEELFNKYQKRKDKLADYKQIISIQQQKIQKFDKQQRKNLEQIVQLKRSLDEGDKQIKNRQVQIKKRQIQFQKLKELNENLTKLNADLNRQLNERIIGNIGVGSISIPSKLPVYTGLTATNTFGRDFSSTISSNSESRLKYSPSPISTSPLLQKTSQRIAPPFRKYREGIQNDKDQQNSHHTNNSHSRSPIVNKLNQQLDPEDADRTRQKIGPIKFKK